jgi:hypothetical protein
VVKKPQDFFPGNIHIFIFIFKKKGNIYFLLNRGKNTPWFVAIFNIKMDFFGTFFIFSVIFLKFSIV